MKRTILRYGLIFSFFSISQTWGQQDPFLENLAVAPDFESHRISSADRTGGNQDWITIEPGETKVLAELEGPGAITHIWNTIDGEKYYSRMLVLRFYWDGQEIPSVEVPLGDFFGVGHGLQRAFQSYPVDVSSDGRARNCYWYMPFAKSAKVTLTHEGFLTLRKFYYYIDYRKFTSFPLKALYFHAQYRQSVPNPKVDLKGKNLDGITNYVLLDTTGKGQYVGSVVSVQMNRDGWFGEGDDMFYIDGSENPSLSGTGTEDYFNDAWGFREFAYPFHGVTLWEGYRKGDRGTAYKWHMHDPVAFQHSLKVTLEHGHANDRQDDWYSVAFWYQTLPSPRPPVLPGVFERLPDEGQLYSQRIFLNKELSLHIDQERIDDALARIDEFTGNHLLADQFGYWSLRKGLLSKLKGDIRTARDALEQALAKSSPTSPKAKERDADMVQWLAQKEFPIVDKKRVAQLYVSCPSAYEIFLDGKSIAKGKGWRSIQEHQVKVSRGKHVLAAVVEQPQSKKGLMIQLSHRGGIAYTDDAWKVSPQEDRNWMKSKYDDSNWQQAVRTGQPGQGDWFSSDARSYFLSDFLTAHYIWLPETVQEKEKTYFRTLIQVH